MSRTFEILRAGGKRPVLVQKDVPGFLANRLQHALFREAISIVEKGIATPQDVDEAIKYGFGMRVGISAPFEVMDMGGLDLTNNIHSYLFPYLEDTHQAQKLLTDHIAKGELGFLRPVAMALSSVLRRRWMPATRTWLLSSSR